MTTKRVQRFKTKARHKYILTFLRSRLPKDARYLQILGLSSFLLIGVLLRDFSVTVVHFICAFTGAMAVQIFAIWLFKLPKQSLLSAFITSCGTTLLLRANDPVIHLLAGAVGIGSKFIFTWNKRHFFNPANMGVIIALNFFNGTWLSPGQWGDDLLILFWIAVIGFLVVTSAVRLDVSFLFIGFYGALLFARILNLGSRWQVGIHQLLNGSLLVFTFFMISDPKTSPSSFSGRVLHCIVVASLTYWWTFVQFKQYGLLYALFLASLLVPLWDHILPGTHYEWPVNKRVTPSDISAAPIPAYR